ncbi:unnamed protein product [Cryptosporidium hominis]|uniref:Uncharacterized protein n=1 Tax=Cryptosporidium hominis TaxID=237895 RepID=A0A0S4TEC5_CRYHO|nr:hypothetical protein ChTU502y2012_389g0220 [Cryptosporidium hominis]PPA63743.1 hypothetical protein ChUKH1_09370 [Cryptosporidium hominis]PPS92843.1 Uncharacterized protein GY17_00002607 [Cryptosporidium hominis]CUV04925.1 unnamed protein product [Cryptosporidium hominis]|eukprot:PPS92843.1 Uncharacterized protein GY17_00002607 [Cryptosporidium hominis]
MFDFINKYVGEVANASASENTERTLSETGSTPPPEESSDEESDVISHTMDWGFLDYVEHLLMLSRSDEGEDLEITKTKVIQDSWSSIDNRALSLHKALLIKADKLYKQDLAALNLINRQDYKRELEKNYFQSLMKALLLNNNKFTAKSVEKIGIQTILKMTPEECKLHQENVSKAAPLTEYEKLVMEFSISN